MTRAIAVNMAMLVTFEEAKEKLAGRVDSLNLRILCAAGFSGMFTVLLSMPFDNVKMKLQKQRQGGSSLFYLGVLDCFK